MIFGFPFLCCSEAKEIKKNVIWLIFFWRAGPGQIDAHYECALTVSFNLEEVLEEWLIAFGVHRSKVNDMIASAAGDDYIRIFKEVNIVV